MLARKPRRAAPRRFVSFAQEITHAIIDMIVNGPIHRCEGAMGEVIRPAAQQAIQSNLHFSPRALVPRRQQFADFRLEISSSVQTWKPSVLWPSPATPSVGSTTTKSDATAHLKRDRMA